MQTQTHTFGDTAASWIRDLEARRNPVAPATIATYRGHIARLLPLVGDSTPLESIHNGLLRDLAGRIPGSPKTIHESLQALKAIVQSVVDSVTGEPVYQRVWNSSFVDAPPITQQKQPCASREQIEHAITSAETPEEKILYAILAGTGLRISEALAIHVGHAAKDQTLYKDGVIFVRSSIYRGQERRDQLKTAAAKRDVDLHPDLARLIDEFIQSEGFKLGNFLFSIPLSTLTDWLHAKGIPGFHSLRRWRISHLRQSDVPESLIRAWVGHSAASITDKYDKSAADRRWRRSWVKRVRLGFDLPGRPAAEPVVVPVIESVAEPAYVADDSDLPDILWRSE